MKHLALVMGSLLSVCFHADAQFPVTNPSLPIADFSAQFTGSYGNGVYDQSQSAYGLFNFSYLAISPPPAPPLPSFYDQISGQVDTYGYTGTTPPQIGIVGSIAPSSLSAVSLNATAILAYQFTVAGTPGTSVSVNVTGSILGNTTQLTGPPFFSETASSSFYVADSVQNLNAAGALSYLSGSTQTTPSGFINSTPSKPTLNLIAGNVYFVELKAELNLNGTFVTPVYGNAGVDPDFTLTPDEIAGGYQIEYSPGIITPVPEPSTWTLFLCGVVGMLVCLAKRKPFKI